MKKQISRLSPHQNAKVIAVLIALSSLIFVVPIALMFSFMGGGFDAEGNAMASPSVALFLLFPFVYLVIGYVTTFCACLIYNLMSRFIGGIEYESGDAAD